MAETSSPGDEIITGTGDETGYHLYIASAAGGWRWAPLATIEPSPTDDLDWTGQQCLTGDGRHAVVVIAPQSALGQAAVADAGALSYVVDMVDGTIRPLLTDVSLRYFSPSCGTGGTAVLTRFLGPDESTTEIIEIDAGTGDVLQQVSVDAEITNAVPTRAGVLGIRGGTVEAIGSDGHERVLSRLVGVPFEMRASGSGPVAQLLVAQGKRVTALGLDARGTVQELGQGSSDGVRLFAGRSGSNLLYGLDAPRTGGAGLKTTNVEIRGHRALAASIDGHVILATGSAQPATAKRNAAVQPAPPDATLIDARSGQVLADELPSPAAPAPMGQFSDKRSHGSRSPGSTAANQTHPTCAVPRNDIRFQVPQPTGDQVDWAIQNAVDGSLEYPTLVRPADYSHLPVPAYEPSVDFPPVRLITPPGMSETIPPQILEGVFAQESNWSQASPHAPRATPGNPLIADYYGVLKSLGGAVDFNLADCGYGIGQVTDGMTIASTLLTSAEKMEVAVDYAENIAAAAQILGEKWNDLQRAGMAVGDGNPDIIENWYFAIWAYNSGLHPLDARGNQGLGWVNNPANPIYPPTRNRFLADPTDASHPQLWPYQERVFGFIQDPLVDGVTGVPLYRSGAGWSGVIEPVSPPYTTFCSPTEDQCDPALCQNPQDPITCNPNVPADYRCHDPHSECWWHSSVGTLCALLCHPGFQVGVGGGEPAATLALPDWAPVCTLDPSFGTGTAIVLTDNAPLFNYNLVGCPTVTSQGTFTVAFGRDTSPYPQAAIDWHQLGGGFGGHFYFTHANAIGDPLTIVGTWTPHIPAGDYQVEAFVPGYGATESAAAYTITTGRGAPAFTRRLDQSSLSNQWATLGYGHFATGASVSLTSAAARDITSDVAFNAIAFVPVAKYVALGDSYSSGEGNQPFYFGTDTTTDNCHTSYLAYPYVFSQETLQHGGRPTFVACSGATTWNLNHPRVGPTGLEVEAPQVSQIPHDASLVTITIGGGDVGFSSVLTRCIEAYVQPFQSPCRPFYSAGDANDLGNRVDNMLPTLAASYTAIHNAAPSARVVVLTYPIIFEDANSPNYDPTIANCAHLLPDDMQFLVEISNQLDDVVVKAAAEAHVEALDERAAFRGHEVCTSSPYAYTAPALPLPSGSYHPTVAGQKRLADDLYGRVG